jgi:hypothetical protein
MEAAANLPPSPAAPGSPGELVVQNGRLSGARRALAVPLTLIGQAVGCDVRLSVEGVNALHCAILADPGGPVLRDLGSASGTRVNGEPVVTRQLCHGDVIEVGPFQFAVELAAPAPAVGLPYPAALEAERDALRVQAAAVVAQQAALAEEEARLQQRSTALQRQEEQLAGHLEERRLKLLGWREQLRQERSAFQEECARARREREERLAEEARARQEADEAVRAARQERQRLLELRRRLKRRWHRQWHARESGLKRREAKLAADREQLAREAAQLGQERGELRQAQLRQNGEAELGRRQLREEWQELGLAQQQWEEALNQEQAERAVRERALEEREAAVVEAEQALAERRSEAEQALAALGLEAEGLETRVRNQRAQLAELERQQASAQPPAPVPLAPPAALAVVVRDEPAWPAAVRRLAGDLADQRAHLAEQWRLLLEVQARWEQERAEALAEVLAGTGRLEQREEQAEARGRVLEVREQELSQRQEALVRQRSALEGRQARLAAREAGWETTCSALLGEVEGQEQQVALRARQLEETQQRRDRRRQEELAELQTLRSSCESLRHNYAELWQECQRQCEELAREGRTLSGRALALERYRVELLARSPNSARAERRVERLRRKDAARLEAEAREVEAGRRVLREESRRLDQRARRLAEQEEELTAAQEALAREVAEWEAKQAAGEQEELRRQQELRRLRAQQALDQGQLAALHDELERVARLLIEEAEGPALPAQQAA